jgi:hypothetical protein
LQKAQAATDAKAQKSIPALRVRLISVLRQRKDFEGALKQLDAQLKENPRALDLLMEKGRILQARAEKDPTKFDDAVAHWNGLRRQLDQPKTRKTADYYEVVLNVATCLVEDARKNKSTEKAAQAGQLLHAVESLSPTLSGPDMVARFKALSAQADELAGRKPKPKPDASARK